MGFLKNFNESRKLKNKLKEQQIKLIQLQNQRIELQNRTFKWVDDNGEPIDNEKIYSGNKYTTYQDAVEEMYCKLNGESEWGCDLAQMIVVFRCAFIIGEKIKPSMDPDVSDLTRAWMEEFVKYNKIRGSLPYHFAQESESNGKFCAILSWNQNYKWEYNGKPMAGMVKISCLPYYNEKYKVDTDKDDYDKFIMLHRINRDKSYDENEFVYRKFGGTLGNTNKPSTPLWKCLSNIEELDQRLSQIGFVNRLNCFPVPVMKTSHTGNTKNSLQGQTFNPRQIIITDGDFGFASPEMQGTQSSMNEIDIRIKRISGVTGIPVHYLGWVDLMSNRATADTLPESINAATVFVRTVTEEAWNEVLTKAAKMQFFMDRITKIETDKISFKINVITEAYWKKLKEFFLPFFEAGGISLPTMWELIPFIDPEEEGRRIKESKEDEYQIINAISSERAENIGEKNESKSQDGSADQEDGDQE